MAARNRRGVAARGEPALIAALPPAATFVPATSLAGVRLGDTPARVRARLGGDFGRCQGCASPTWYFTYRRFDDKGLGVEFAKGRVSAVYTLWQPDGWRAANGLRLGAPEGAVTSKVGAVIPVACNGYTALVSRTSAYFVVDGKLWGFGLFPKGASPCR